MENFSKSSDLLTRLRSVTLEDELQLSDFYPVSKSSYEKPEEPAFQSDRLNSFISSWNDSDTFASSGSSFKFESDPSVPLESTPESTPECAVPMEQSAEKTSASVIFTPGPVENQENPFAKMSRKGASLTSGLPKKLGGWLMNTSFFGILGVLCGGLLTAWSILSGTGSHSLTSLGLSLTISGLLMLVSVGICQTALHTSGQA